jgi:hypothetical protein
MNRDFPIETTHEYSATVVLSVATTVKQRQNSYGDQPKMAPERTVRKLVDVSITADELQKMIGKIISHVQLAE